MLHAVPQYHVTSLAGGLATAGTAALPAPLAAGASDSSDDLIITHDTQSSAAHTGDADVYLEPHPRASGMCLAGHGADVQIASAANPSAGCRLVNSASKGPVQAAEELEAQGWRRGR